MNCPNPTAPPQFSNGILKVNARLFVYHARSGTSSDTLYAFITIGGAGNSTTDDILVLMLDTQHTHALGDVVGLCFTRTSPKIAVTSTPDLASTAACSGTPILGPNSCSGTPRGCVLSNGGIWNVEVKLVPGDFGLASFQSFLGTVGIMIRTVDAGGLAAAGPVQSGVMTTVDPVTPSSWADLNLGVALDVALVLDLSGSMNALACATGCPTRLQVLQTAVNEFVTAYSLFAWYADRITVRYFQTAVMPFPPSGALVHLPEKPCPGLMLNESCADTIKGDVNIASANNLTALGQGLLQAITALPAPTPNVTRRRHIIAFSDGMQNVSPLVDEIVPGTCPGTATDQYAGHDFQIQSVCLNGLGYPIHTLGIAGSTKFTQMMDHIGLETGGAHFETINIPDVTAQAFVTQVENLLKLRSPQLVGYRLGIASSDTTREPFTINGGVQKILLTLSWSPGSRLSFQVLKDGKNVTEAGHIIREATYQMFTMDLPRRSGPDTVTAEGQWDLLIEGKPGTSYQVWAMVDEHRLVYDFSVGSGYLAGDHIQLTAQVSLDGKPADEAIVTAIVGKPGESIGTLLSVNPTPSTTPSVPPEPSASPAQKKLQLLLEDPKHWASIQPVNGTVQLKSIGGGKYSATFAGTDVVGPYPVLFRLDRSTVDLGRFLRTRLMSANVQFGDADGKASELVIRSVVQTTTGQTAILHARPKNRFRDFLGPDFGDQINVSLTDGTAGTPSDLVDGGYDIVLAYPAGKDPGITIKVVGRTMFTGRVSDLIPQPGGAFGPSLHGGISLPSGNLKTTNDRGFGITADAEYWFTRRLALQGLFGYHRFGGKGTNPDLEITHASAGLELRITTGSPSILVDGGGGTYRFKPGSTKTGTHAGVSLEFKVSPRVSLGLNGRLHTVFTTGSHTTFYSVQAGGWIRL